MCWLRELRENPLLVSSWQRCPALGHPGVVVTAKPSAMETIVQPQERAGQLPSAGPAQLRPALRTHGGLRSSAGAPSGLWSPLLAETPTGSLPLFMANRQPCCLPALVLPEARGRACELVAGDAPQWASELAGPSLCEQRRVCTQAWPGSPSPPGLQAFLGTEDRNQPCRFQAARLLRNSRLSPETPSPAQPWPLSEKRVPAPPPASLLFSDKGEGSGEGLQPRLSPTPAPSCLMSECRSWGSPGHGLLAPVHSRTTLGSFLNSNSKPQPWGTGVLAALRDLLDFQGPICLADGREAGRKGA